MTRGVTPAVGKRRDYGSRSESDSGSDDGSVVCAPGIHGIAFEPVPRFERLKEAGPVEPLRRVARVHRRADLFLRPCDLPDAQVVDRALGHEVPVRVAADADVLRRRQLLAVLRRLEDENAVDGVPARDACRPGREPLPDARRVRNYAARFQAHGAVEIAAHRRAAEAQPPAGLVSASRDGRARSSARVTDRDPRLDRHLRRVEQRIRRDLDVAVLRIALQLEVPVLCGCGSAKEEKHSDAADDSHRGIIFVNVRASRSYLSAMHDFVVRESTYSPGLRQRRHAHDYSNITIVIAGKIEEAAERGEYCAHPGSVVTKGAGCAHEDRIGGPGGRAIRIQFYRDSPLAAGAARGRSAFSFTATRRCRRARGRGSIRLPSSGARSRCGVPTAPAIAIVQSRSWSPRCRKSAMSPSARNGSMPSPRASIAITINTSASASSSHSSDSIPPMPRARSARASVYR